MSEMYNSPLLTGAIYMTEKDLEKAQETIATLRDTFTDYLFEVVIVVYFQPDKGKPQLDFIVGPFDSDRTALIWATDNQNFIKKGIVHYELSIRPKD